MVATLVIRRNNRFYAEFLASRRWIMWQVNSYYRELRQTPFQISSNNSTSSNYEDKRRRWKDEMKKRIQTSKQPPRQLPVSGPVGTAGRYYITYNPYSNAYQVSRQLPSYIRKEDFEPEV